MEFWPWQTLLNIQEFFTGTKNWICNLGEHKVKEVVRVGVSFDTQITLLLKWTSCLTPFVRFWLYQVVMGSCLNLSFILWPWTWSYRRSAEEKFNKLAKTRIPTGDLTMPPYITEAKTIRKLMNEKNRWCIWFRRWGLLFPWFRWLGGRCCWWFDGRRQHSRILSSWPGWWKLNSCSAKQYATTCSEFLFLDI